jgi:hypothetical protein
MLVATPQEAPTGFRARGLTHEEVLLWWRGDATGAERLRVEIGEGPFWRRVADLPSSAVVYSVQGLEPATRRRFRLGAVGAKGDVAWTAPQEASTFPALYRGKHWVVRPDGSDSAAGTADAPFRTIGHAASMTRPGDTVWIGEGVYRESVTVTGGNAEAWISFRRIPGERPVLEGDGRLSTGLTIQNTGFVEIRGLTVRNFRYDGIACRRTGPVTIRECELYRNGSAGVTLNFTDYKAQLLVENNITYENGWFYGWASGIHLNNKLEGDNVVHVIRRNLSYNNFDGSENHTDGNGIMFDLGGTGGFCLIESNVCFNNGGRGINVLDGAAYVLHNTTFRNGWDKSFQYAPAELEIANRNRTEASGSIVRNNIFWARPKVRGFGGAIHLVRGARPSFAGNLVWSDEPEEVRRLPEGASAFATPIPFVSVSQDDEFQEIHGRSFLKMEAADYDFRLQEWPEGAPASLDTGLRRAFGGLWRNPRMPAAGAWPLGRR